MYINSTILCKTIVTLEMLEIITLYLEKNCKLVSRKFVVLNARLIIIAMFCFDQLNFLL